MVAPSTSGALKDTINLCCPTMSSAFLLLKFGNHLKTSITNSISLSTGRAVESPAPHAQSRQKANSHQHNPSTSLLGPSPSSLQQRQWKYYGKKQYELNSTPAISSHIYTSDLPWTKHGSLKNPFRISLKKSHSLVLESKKSSNSSLPFQTSCLTAHKLISSSGKNRNFQA